MRADIFNHYFEAMTCIEAQETLRDFSVSDYPHVKPKSRRKTHRKMYQLAYPHIFESAPRIDADAFFGKPRVKHGE